jgi:hypothetical protein
MSLLHTRQKCRRTLAPLATSTGGHDWWRSIGLVRCLQDAVIAMAIHVDWSRCSSPVLWRGRGRKGHRFFPRCAAAFRGRPHVSVELQVRRSWVLSFSALRLQLDVSSKSGGAQGASIP